MNKKSGYGILSMACLFISVFIAAQTLLQHNMVWPLLYISLTVFAGISVVGAFCIKCPVKSCCPHVLPGYFTRFMNEREPGPYTRAELFITFLSVGIILFFPQPWLVRHGFRLGLFWILAGAGLILIVRNVCTHCDNLHCPFRKKGKGSESSHA